MCQPLPKNSIICKIDQLTPFERDEIETQYLYQEIYYLGLCVPKIVASKGKLNDYNDKDGFYKVVINDHIMYRFEIIEIIGRGVFGEVILAFDHKTKTNVALKVLKTSELINVRSMFYEETRKLQVLSEMYPDLNVVKMLDFFIFRGHPCIVLELLHKNVGDVIRANHKGFALPVVKGIIRTLVQALCQIHKLNLVHCDIKPENIVFVKEGQYDVKLIDFGNSMIIPHSAFGYVQTRYYRAPEVIFRLPFKHPIDMWSIGCTAMEIFIGRVFLQGKCEKDQIIWITSAIGSPPVHLIAKSHIAKNYFQADGKPKFLLISHTEEETLNNEDNDSDSDDSSYELCCSTPTLLTYLKKSGSSDFIDFIAQCLNWDADKRITAFQALSHPWLMD